MKRNIKALSGVMAAMIAVSAMSALVSAEGEEDDSLTLETAPVVTEAVTEPVETTPVVTITTTTNGSPKTGQSAYVLAAIPVALAAAALLCRKTGKKDKE